MGEAYLKALRLRDDLNEDSADSIVEKEVTVASEGPANEVSLWQAGPGEAEPAELAERRGRDAGRGGGGGLVTAATRLRSLHHTKTITFKSVQPLLISNVGFSTSCSTFHRREQRGPRHTTYANTI